MPARLVFVVGGQRSGKSRMAEEIASSGDGQRIYLATATACDEEMAERIARHRARRGSEWALIEERTDLAGALRHAAEAGTTVLVECLTLWLSNLFEGQSDVEAEADRLLASLTEMPGRAVVVSNEVGAGIVPANALARRYADALGVLNQRVAALADEVILMVAGLPLYLKRGGTR